MFGYIKPFKPELKLCEFDAYKAVYCGLCGELGRSFGFFARFTLSYDFTFVSMLHFSLNGDTAELSCGRCCMNPLKRTPCIKDADALRFGANLAAIMLYHKLRDNIADSGFIKRLGWYALNPLAAAARKKAARAMPEADVIVSEFMQKQALVESELCPSPDRAAEPTADAMSKLLCLIPSEEHRNDGALRILSRIGYLLGRFIYICDALDDIESDIKSGGYNPLALKFGITKGKADNLSTDKLSMARAFARDSLYMTVGEMEKAYDLLELHDFRPVLDNIITLGLQNTAREIYERPAKKPPNQ